jgi:hypothetical protein
MDLKAHKPIPNAFDNFLSFSKFLLNSGENPYFSILELEAGRFISRTPHLSWPQSSYLKFSCFCFCMFPLSFSFLPFLFFFVPFFKKIFRCLLSDILLLIYCNFVERNVFIIIFQLKEKFYWDFQIFLLSI